MKSAFYTTGDDQFSGWTKKLGPKAKSAPRKGHGHYYWSAALLIHYRFQVLVKPLYLRTVLSRSMRCTENCNACSWHWSTEWAQFFSTVMPNQCFKSWTNWATKFCLICCIHLTSHQPTTTSSSILTTFCRENASTTIKRLKMLSKSSLNLKAQSLLL